MAGASEALQAQLERVLTDSAKEAAAMCASLMRDRIEQVLEEERDLFRRQLQQMSPGDRSQLAAEHCPPAERPVAAAWTRGFFDIKVEKECPEASQRRTLQLPELAPVADQDMDQHLKSILANAYDMKEKVHEELVKAQGPPSSARISESPDRDSDDSQGPRNEVRKSTCSIQRIMRMIKKLHGAARSDEEGSVREETTKESSEHSSSKPPVPPEAREPPAKGARGAQGGAPRLSPALGAPSLTTARPQAESPGGALREPSAAERPAPRAPTEAPVPRVDSLGETPALPAPMEEPTAQQDLPPAPVSSQVRAQRGEQSPAAPPSLRSTTSPQAKDTHSMELPSLSSGSKRPSEHSEGHALPGSAAGARLPQSPVNVLQAKERNAELGRSLAEIAEALQSANIIGSVSAGRRGPAA